MQVEADLLAFYERKTAWPFKESPPPYDVEARLTHERTPLLLPPPPPYTETRRRTVESQVHDQRRRDRIPRNALYEDEDKYAVIPSQGQRRCWRFRRVILVVFIIALFGFGAGWLAKSESQAVAVHRVAVVGAGPAGISAAYALRNTPAVRVTVIEQSPHIGGRLFLSSSLSTEIASSTQGKIHAEDLSRGNLVSLNPLLASQAARVLGQKGLQDGRGDEGVVKVGFWDGKGFRLVEMRPVGRKSLWDFIREVLRYGPSVWNARKLPTGTMNSFRAMLQLGMRVGKDRFDDVESWIKQGRMDTAVVLSAKDRLNKNGIKGAYVSDVVETVLHRQFGQGVEEVNDLTVSMGFEREFSSASGGRGRLSEVLRGFLDKSRGELQLNTKVNFLQKLANEETGKVEWLLGLNGASTQVFDKVILAAPWNTSSLLGSAAREDTEQLAYRSQWQTFVVSSAKLNASYFGMKEGTLPDHILPISSSDSLGLEMEGVRSIELVRAIFGPDTAPKVEAVSYLYSVSSASSLPASTIETLFGKESIREVLSEEIQNAFPLLYPRKEGFGTFQVDEDGIWHTSVGEAVASSVDWSWVVGERVGELVAQSLKE